MCSTYSILPRKGEVAPKVTEGEDTEQTCRMPPLRLARASHLPLAGEDYVRPPVFRLRWQFASHAEEVEDVE